MYKKNLNITFKAIFSRFKRSLCILSTIVLKMLLDALNRRFKVLGYTRYLIIFSQMKKLFSQMKKLFNNNIQSDEKIIRLDEKIIHLDKKISQMKKLFLFIFLCCNIFFIYL